MPRPVHEQLADTKGPFECRSEPAQSEVSSHIARPRWRRLLRAAALLLSQGIHPPGREGEAQWIYPDAVGGGTETDFFRLLTALLDACDLAEEETGTVLIGMYSFMQANDLPMTAQTWRALTVTAMLASLKVVINDCGMVARAEARLRDSVMHWWPKVNADKALKVFTSRALFKEGLLTPSRIADCYFTLRDRSLAMQNDEDSVASAVNSLSQAPPRQPGASAGGGRRRSGSGASGRQRSSGGAGGEDLSVSQGTSFFLSEDGMSTASSHRSLQRSIVEEEEIEDRSNHGDEQRSSHTISL